MANEKRAADTLHQRKIAGKALQFVFDNHRRQQHRLDHLDLLQLFTDLFFDVSENLLLTLLQDLGERGYLSFKEEKNKDDELRLRFIQITPAGRDIVRGFKKDDAVWIE